MPSSQFNRHGVSLPPSAGDHSCVSLELAGHTPFSPADLALEIEAAAKFYRDSHTTTVWIDVVEGDVPDALLEALTKVSGLGAGIVVTQEAKLACSHGPGTVLAISLCRAVYQINRGGFVWHPYAQTLVASKPLG